jgi:hypothetical protein
LRLFWRWMNWRVVRNRKNRNSSPSGLNDLSVPYGAIFGIGTVTMSFGGP